MCRTSLTVALWASLFIICPAKASDNSDQAMIAVNDFQPLANSTWAGSLTYLDYSDNSQQEIPVAVRFDGLQKESLVYQIQYPGESQYNETARFTVGNHGQQLNDEKVVSRCRTPDETLVVKTHSLGEDNNRAVEIRMTYSIGPNELILRKEVRSDGEDKYLQRSEYRLSRTDQ